VNYDGAFAVAREGSGWIFAVWLAPLPTATSWRAPWRIGCAPSELGAGVEADAVLRAEIGRGAKTKALAPSYARAASREASGRPPRLRAPRAQPTSFPMAPPASVPLAFSVMAYAYWSSRLVAEIQGKPAPSPADFGLFGEPFRPWDDRLDVLLRDMIRQMFAGLAKPTVGRAPPPAAALEALGIAWPTTVDETRRAFRRRAYELHPDRRPGDDGRHFVALCCARDLVLAVLEKSAGGGMTT